MGCSLLQKAILSQVLPSADATSQIYQLAWLVPNWLGVAGSCSLEGNLSKLWFFIPTPHPAKSDPGGWGILRNSTGAGAELQMIGICGRCLPNPAELDFIHVAHCENQHRRLSHRRKVKLCGGWGMSTNGSHILQRCHMVTKWFDVCRSENMSSNSMACPIGASDYRNIITMSIQMQLVVFQISVWKT